MDYGQANRICSWHQIRHGPVPVGYCSMFYVGVHQSPCFCNFLDYKITNFTSRSNVLSFTLKYLMTIFGMLRVIFS